MDDWITATEHQITRVSVRYGMPYGNGEGYISEDQKKYLIICSLKSHSDILVY